MCVFRTPWFNGWGFNLSRGQSLLDKWNQVPEDIDILMTHGPPLGKAHTYASAHRSTHTLRHTHARRSTHTQCSVQVWVTVCVCVAGFRDWVPKELQRVGCVELLNTVQHRVQPKLHAFGGIHEG